eukprot:246381_1
MSQNNGTIQNRYESFYAFAELQWKHAWKNPLAAAEFNVCIFMGTSVVKQVLGICIDRDTKNFDVDLMKKVRSALWKKRSLAIFAVNCELHKGMIFQSSAEKSRVRAFTELLDSTGLGTINSILAFELNAAILDKADERNRPTPALSHNNISKKEFEQVTKEFDAQTEAITGCRMRLRHSSEPWIWTNLTLRMHLTEPEKLGKA